MNVHEVDEAGRFKMGWCFLPERCLARGDVMLAQKIALETSEIRALSVAVMFVPKRPGVAPRNRLVFEPQLAGLAE
jgi:hypothetical protein